MAKKDWNKWFEELSQRKQAELAAKLAEAKAEASDRGKEPFDFDRLLSYNVPPQLRSPPSRATSLERQYYLDHPELMTLAQFTDYLNAELEFDGGGLDKGE